MSEEEKIKKYITLQEKAKLAFLTMLNELGLADLQTLQARVSSEYYKNAIYAPHLCYQTIEALSKEGSVNLNEMSMATNRKSINNVLFQETAAINEILALEWGAGDFKYLPDFKEALHIMARLIMQGGKTASRELTVELESDVYEGSGVFENLSKSQATYRKRVIIPRTIQLLGQLRIIGLNEGDGSITILLDKLNALIPQYGNQLISIIKELSVAERRKIEELVKLFNETKESNTQLKEEISSLSIIKSTLDEQLKSKEASIAQFQLIANFIERTKVMGIDINWVITCVALNLGETAIKKKLMEMGVSREKVMNKEFEENSKLLEKLLFEQEHRTLTSRLLFNDVYKKARGKIDHEGHLHKPSIRECTYILDETVDFIDELFKVDTEGVTSMLSTIKWKPLPIIKFNAMGPNLKRVLPQVGWELTNHSPYQLKIRIEVHPWLGGKDLYDFILDPHITGKKAYSAEPNSMVWGNGTFSIPNECVASTEELVVEIRSFVTDVNEPQKGEHKMLSSIWKYVRSGDYWFYYPQGP